MRTVVVGFSYSKKRFALFSQLIRWWDRTNYSHVYFQFESPKYNVQLIYQASSVMLNYMAKPVFQEKNEIIKEFEIEITDDQYFSLMKSCMLSSGRDYSTLQIIGIVISDILKLKNNPFPSKNEFVCSEWVAMQLVALGYEFEKSLDLVKPSDVYKVLESHEKT